MKSFYLLVAILVIGAATTTEARKKKHKSDAAYGPSTKSKTKTKWSSSTDNGPNGAVVATEEHGYYVKRTYLPLNSTGVRQSPPYLGIPIAWFSCAENKNPADCLQSNSAAIAGNKNAMTNDGFLCDDDCALPYAPVCGKTNAEVAVFYNKCKLNVAKCRTHGMWQDLPYAECQQEYPKETAYADKKFRASPFFKDSQPEQLPVAASAATIATSDIAAPEQQALVEPQQQQQPQNNKMSINPTEQIQPDAAFNEVNGKAKITEQIPLQPVKAEHPPADSIMIN